MSRMLMFSSIGVILFSLAAGTSWYLQYRTAARRDPQGRGRQARQDRRCQVQGPRAGRPLVRAPLSPDADRLTVMSATLQTQQQTLKNS